MIKSDKLQIYLPWYGALVRDVFGKVKNKLSQVMGTGLIMNQQNLHNFDKEITFLFNMLDADGSGWLDADEFVEGLLRVTDGSVQNSDAAECWFIK